MSACPAPARSVAAPAVGAATRIATMAARTPLPIARRLDGCLEDRADQAVGRVLGCLDGTLAAEPAARLAGRRADGGDARAAECPGRLVEGLHRARRGEHQQVGRQRLGALVVTERLCDGPEQRAELHLAPPRAPR